MPKTVVSALFNFRDIATAGDGEGFASARGGGGRRGGGGSRHGKRCSTSSFVGDGMHSSSASSRRYGMYDRYCVYEVFICVFFALHRDAFFAFFCDPTG